MNLILLIILILIIFIIVWGFCIEPYMLVVKNIELEIKELTKHLKEVKIVHLSDLHSFNFGKKEKKVLKILKDINPDFIFITGDIISKKTKNLNSCEKFWKELSIMFYKKIFVVYGNHDFLNPEFHALNHILKQQNINVLRNESIELKFKNSCFYLMGVDDPHLNYDDIERAAQEINNKETLKILLAHSPEIFRKTKDRNIDLVLVGHTHGCQANIPFLCNLVVPLKHDKQYKKGLFQNKNTYMYVNSGIGESLIPIRINAFPEIALITFK